MSRRDRSAAAGGGNLVAGLIEFDTTPFSPLLSVYLGCRYDRVVLTGAGAAHIAALPAWRRLVAAGQPACWIEPAELRHCPDLAAGRTLVIATNATGELVASLPQRSADTRDETTFLAVTEDPVSPLALSADCTLSLPVRGDTHADDVARYLNMLAAQELLGSMLLKRDCDEVAVTVAAVSSLTLPPELCAAAVEYRYSARPRLAFFGYQDHAATALYAAYVADRIAGVTARPIIGEQFDENVQLFGGPSLTAVFFGGENAQAAISIGLMAAQLRATGSTVIAVGCAESGEVGASAELACGAVIAYMFATELARADIDAPTTLAALTAIDS